MSLPCPIFSNSLHRNLTFHVQCLRVQLARQHQFLAQGSQIRQARAHSFHHRHRSQPRSQRCWSRCHAYSQRYGIGQVVRCHSHGRSFAHSHQNGFRTSPRWCRVTRCRSFLSTYSFLSIPRSDTDFSLFPTSFCSDRCLVIFSAHTHAP